MSLKEKIKTQLTSATKAQDKTRMEVLRALIAAIQYEEMAKGVENLDEAVGIEILKREAKKREEERQYAEQSGRAELITKVTAELTIISDFLPKQLSKSDLENAIKAFVSAGAKDMGAIMKLLKERHNGQYDAKLASEIVRNMPKN